jgi:hypothetical protein
METRVMCYKFAFRNTSVLSSPPLSKPFKTKEQAEKAREKYPERLRKRIGIGAIRIKG